MKSSKIIAAVSAMAALFVGGAAFAQGPIITTTTGPRPHIQHTINPQKKAASDQAMNAGLGQLQQAQAAFTGGNTVGAVSDLQAAAASMTAALPIYDGYRERAIKSAGDAIKLIQSGKPKAQARAASVIARAISDAQTALTKN